MATRKKKMLKKFEFEFLPVEISLSELEFEAIQSQFEISEKGVYFEGGNQFHSVCVLSKKEDSENDNKDDD